MDEARLSTLIGDIYDASLDPTLWPAVLERSAGYVGGTASALFLKDSARKTHNNVYTWGYDPEFTRIYLERYVQLDPFTTGQFFFDVGEPVCLADIMPHTEFRASRFYNEWVKPQRWIDALGVTLDKSATTYAAFSVIRHEDDGVVDDEARHRARLIVPHIRRAVFIGKVIDLRKVEAALLADTLDGLADAMFLVNAGGRVVHANAAGHALLAQGAALRASAGRLAAIDGQADRALHEIFVNAEAGDAAAAAALLLTAPDGTRYVVHVLPLTSGARKKAGVAYAAVAAVFVRKTALDLPHPMETIATTFKLTPAEMRVLMLIFQMGGVPEIASVLGLSETTVRTHLQRLFAKTGSRRQADLVKLVAGYMSPLASS